MASLVFKSLLLLNLFVFLMGTACSQDKTAGDSSEYKDSYKNQVSIAVQGSTRVIKSNSIPAHAVGEFPNSNNPNSIEAQDLSYSVTINPSIAIDVTLGSAQQLGDGYAESGLGIGPTIGIAVNGVLLEPGTAEVWDINARNQQGRRQPGVHYEWSYDGLGSDRTGAFVGMDDNKGHVQPTGKYHYHGISSTSKLYTQDGKHSPLVGFAADGHPIFGPYGYDENGVGIQKMYANYKLKGGGEARIAVGGQDPGGNYDGTFVEDYEFAYGVADVDNLETGNQVSILDQANGHIGKVPADELEKYGGYAADYLGAKNSDDTYTVYHYHITDNFPYMPRKLAGTVHSSFKQGR